MGAFEPSGQDPRPRVHAGVALALLVALLGWAYRETALSIANKWLTDMTYSHGALVVPISLWLVWQRRSALAAVAWQPSWWGVAALAAASVCWIVARAAGVQVIEQLALAAMISAVVLTVLGWPAYRTIAFPLGFLVFAVPFGRGLVPALMQVTADISASALNFNGVPVYRNNMILSIPGGDFEVAHTCSGLNFLITAIVLGSLYAYLTYRGWRKRLVFIAAGVGVIIVANGMRAYLTIAIAHWTDMRYGTGYDHVVFGRILFVLVMLAMFWIGQRWRDPSPQDSPAVPPAAPAAHGSAARGSAFAIAVCLLLIVGTPWYLSAATARRAVGASLAGSVLALPAPGADWRRGPLDDAGAWRPLFSGAVAEQSAAYRDRDDRDVDVYVGVYALGRPDLGEMITYRNRLYAQEHRSLLPERAVTLRLADGATLEARELVIPEREHERLVWYWFMIGDRSATSRSAAKALEVLAVITRSAVFGRVITFATKVDPRIEDHDAARRRLERFVGNQPTCIRDGFTPRACPR
jgi:exosortase A